VTDFNFIFAIIFSLCFCSTNGIGDKYYKILVAETGGKRTLGRTRYRGKDNIKIDLREVELRGVGRILPAVVGLVGELL
jgi:hypothetical protein